jgi:tetratricopeptide (TPR) repeat protein
VAYETLSKRERKTKHLAAAGFLMSLSGAEEGEAIEVVASHYLDAYTAAPNEPDAAEVRARAYEMFSRAGERAASLAANAQAQQSFERAAGLTDDPLAQAEMYERAGAAAAIAARAEEASALFERSRGLLEAQGSVHSAARVSARLAQISWDRGRLEEGLEIMERSLAVLLSQKPNEDVAALAAQVGRFRFFAGEHEVAYQRIETALSLAEALALPEVLAEALDTKALILITQGRPQEGSLVLRHALEIALDNDKPSAALRAFYNLADAGTSAVDRYEDSAETVRQGLAHARRVGNRYWEWLFLGFGFPFYALGKWDDVLSMGEELPREDWRRARAAFGTELRSAVPIWVHRGRLDDAKRMASALSELERSADVQERAYYGLANAQILLAERKPEQALRVAESVFEQRIHLGIAHDTSKEAFALALQAALELGQLDKARDLLRIAEEVAPGLRPQFVNATVVRFRAHLAAREGAPEDADRLFKGAGGLLDELGVPFYLAITRLEHGEWLTGQDREQDAQPLLAQARETFERLEARPWLQRTERRARLAGSVT